MLPTAHACLVVVEVWQVLAVAAEAAATATAALGSWTLAPAGGGVRGESFVPHLGRRRGISGAGRQLASESGRRGTTTAHEHGGSGGSCGGGGGGDGKGGAVSGREGTRSHKRAKGRGALH